MKRSFNFAGSAATQRRRVTTSAVADVLPLFFTPSEIEQLRKEHEAIKAAVADVLAHKERHGMVNSRVMIGIAIANGLQPKKLMKALEEGKHIKPGATRRFEALLEEKGETWQSLTEKAMQKD